MPKNPYLRSLLFGSVIPWVIFGLMYTALIFSGQQWLPLIALMMAIYSMPPALIVTLAASIWLMRGWYWWQQLITGLLLCCGCVIMAYLVLKYN